MLIGEVRFNQRQFVMDEETGNRLPKFLDPDQHKVRRIEELRVIPDEKFEAILTLQKSRARQKGATKAVRGVPRSMRGIVEHRQPHALEPVRGDVHRADVGVR